MHTNRAVMQDSDFAGFQFCFYSSLVVPKKNKIWIHNPQTEIIQALA